MTPFEQWAKKWGVPPQAIKELGELSQAVTLTPDTRSEAWLQSRLRLDAVRADVLLWRNNKGVLPDANGTPVRFGLCNDNKAIGAAFASADLIGIKRVQIGPQHVGQTLGQFASIEVKAPGAPLKMRPGQKEWADLVTAWGGWAKITNTPDIF